MAKAVTLALLIKELGVSNFEQTGLSGLTRLRVHLNPGERVMHRVVISVLLLAGFTALSTMEASAGVVCARGVYRAGCVATGGSAVVRHPVGRAAVVVPRRGIRR